MKVAIIDDSKYKMESLSSMVKGSWPNLSLCFARSFQTGLKLLEDENPEIVLMDMTLPTSEGAGGKLDGRNRMFGGRELLAEMEFLGLKGRVIVVTQFEEFPDGKGTIDLTSLLASIAKRFPVNYAGGVYFGSVDTTWVNELKRIIERELASYEDTNR